jgi:ribosomal protein S27AE
MHQKERVMAPILSRELGINVIVPENFDTDRFGTFTRHIKRTGSQVEAARFKALAAMEVTGAAIAFASEGTFGPHPFVPGLSLNREIVIFIDKKHDIEIIAQEASIETNFNSKKIKQFDQAYAFAKQVGFPSHGLVVMFNTSSADRPEIIKGIASDEQLLEAVTLGLSQSRDGRVQIETDMRSHYNPTRMKNIEKATLDLIGKLNQLCPQCDWPGFDLVDRKLGLPCGVCGFPTEMKLAVIYQCKKCGFSEQKLFPDGIETADPARCSYCNP